MIRLAIIKDADACFTMAKLIYGDFMLKHSMEMIDEDLKKYVEFFINSKQALVVERDGKVVGMTAWLLVPHPANKNCIVFQEVLWAVDSPNKTDALLLLRAIELKANEVGANVVVLANLSLDNEPKLRRIYNKMGYQYLESYYARAN